MDEQRSCPRCGCPNFYIYKVRPIFRCKECGHQFSATSGTLFSSPKLPRYLYEGALRLVVEDRRGVSSLSLAWHLECQQKSAWYLVRRIREAQRMKQTCRYCGAVNVGAPLPEDRPLLGFRCGHCKGITSVNCTHPQLPDLGRDNPVSLQQCPDCHAAMYWDDGWRPSGIKFTKPNMTDDERFGAFVSQAMSHPKDGYTYKESKKRGKERRARRSMKCPHCGHNNPISPQIRTPAKLRCGACDLTFRRAAGPRMVKKGPLPWSAYRQAWDLFAAGNDDKQVAQAVGISHIAAFRWLHLWRDGYQIPEGAE